MKKIIIFMSLILIILFNCKKNNDAVINRKNDAVSIKKNKTYYHITIDYTTGISPKDAGKQLGKKILQEIPDYEEVVEKVLFDMVRDICYLKGDPDATADAFNEIINLVHVIRPTIKSEYYEEIEGIASNFHYSEPNNLMDGKLTRDEFYFYNLIIDIGGFIFGKLIGKKKSPTGCTVMSVFDEMSATSKPVISRLLDCNSIEFSKIHAVTTIKNNERSICLIGAVGINSVISILNDNKIFSAVLFSHAGKKCDNKDPLIPIGYDLRFALEEYSMLYDISAYLNNNKNHYITNSIIFISDSVESKVLENDLTEFPKNSELRSYDSKLHDGVKWNIDYSVASVNSFLLYDNENNHSNISMNYLRWDNLVSEFSKAEKTTSDKGEKITVDEIKTISSFYQNKRPGDMSEGDIYNHTTKQMIIFQPDTMSLEIYFTPAVRELPKKPSFNKIDINF